MTNHTIDKEKYLQEPIEILELIARLTKILKDNGIHTLADVYALRIVDIDMRGIGPVLRLELFNVLNELEPRPFEQEKLLARNKHSRCLGD